MTSLKTFGILCLILVFFGPLVDLVIVIYRKPQPAQIDKDGKRELKINRISFWDYLTLIVPACLLLIGLLSNEQKERAISFAILGMGYTMLILSSYNRRIDIPKINCFVFCTCLTLAFVSFILGQSKVTYFLPSGTNSLTLLYFPATAYIFFQASRHLIKLTTNTYPVTLDREVSVGHFYTRYNRKTTYWDLAWTMLNIGGFPMTIIYILELTQ